jgi:hypothetical protein
MRRIERVVCLRFFCFSLLNHNFWMENLLLADTSQFKAHLLFKSPSFGSYNTWPMKSFLPKRY